MKIYTTYFAKLKKLPENIVPVSITRFPIKNWNGLEYRKLAPTAKLLYMYKRQPNEALYKKYYNQQILAPLNVHEVVKQFAEMSGGKDVALVCYEKSGDFCHRHLVASWLRENGYETEEWEEEK